MTRQQRIAIRTDATGTIGTGHFMRCLTLAESLLRTGAEVRFICRELPEHLARMLSEKSIPYSAIIGEPPAPPSGPLAHARWLWTDQRHDALACQQILGNTTWDWLIVDHYALDEDWENSMRGLTRKIMVIDDLADRRHNCDVLLDQNYYIDMDHRYIGKVPEKCRLLLGPRYALLRDEFRILRNHLKPRTGEVNRIMVFFGGVDADNYTGKTITVLGQLGRKDVEVDVVIGAQHPQRDDVQLACTVAGFTCHVQTPDIARLMAEADLSIGAGGITTWERCCLGLPTIAVSIADNQCEQINDAAEHGLLVTAQLTPDFSISINNLIQTLMNNHALMRLISRTAYAHVDGRGVMRILNVISPNNIQIRRVTNADAKDLFDWRNHPDIRRVSRNHAELDWASHNSWLEQSIRNADRELLIGELDNHPVGVVRFDLVNETAEVSIYLVPTGKFSGYGENLLVSAENWLKTFHPQIKRLDAAILGDNLRSQNFFHRAGYNSQSVNFSKVLRD